MGDLFHLGTGTKKSLKLVQDIKLNLFRGCLFF